MDGLVSDRHWTSGSQVMSFLGVWEMWVAVLERKAATRRLSCAGDWGRIDVKKGCEIVFQVLLLLSNRTQGSWIRMMSLVLLLLLLYFMRRMQPIGYGVAIYILELKPFVVLLSLQFLVKHSVELLLLFCSDSPCYLPSVTFSTA